MNSRNPINNLLCENTEECFLSDHIITNIPANMTTKNGSKSCEIKFDITQRILYVILSKLFLNHLTGDF